MAEISASPVKSKSLKRLADILAEFSGSSRKREAIPIASLTKRATTSKKQNTH